MLRYNVLYNAGNAPQKFSCLRTGSLVGKARSREQIMGGGEGGVGEGVRERATVHRLKIQYPVAKFKMR